MWDERYNTEEYQYGTKPNEFLKHYAHQIPEGNVLCLAEGEGRNAVFLALQGYEVTAVDSSAVGLEKAQRLAQDYGVSIKTVHADLADFDLGIEQWDGIVSIFCHLPPSLRKKIHAQVVQSLKHGGVFLLEAYTPDQLKYATGGPPVAELMMTVNDLSEELKGLGFNHLMAIEREVLEGNLHFGKGAVVQAIGRKP